MKPGSVVLLGPSYGQYVEAVTAGFRQNGLQAACFTYPDPAVKPMDLLAWTILPSIGMTAFRKTSLEETLRHTRAACRNADLLIVIKGDQIPLVDYCELLDQVDCPSVLWLMDSIRNVKQGRERARLADALLYFEGSDRELLTDLPVPSHQVAMATDPAWYHPLDNVAPVWDVSFFGVFHDNRLSTFESILAELPLQVVLSTRFAGPWRTRNHPFRARKRMGRYPLTAHRLKHVRYWSHDQINVFYNQSRMCLNVLHPQSRDSLNPRAFETCCAGSLLVCESNAALERCFDVDREVVSFDTPAEAAEKILFYLRNDAARASAARAGRERVLKDHTMKVRTRQILDFLKTDGPA